MLNICAQGLRELKVAEWSLFVLAHNDNAIKAYEKFGFELDKYPEEIPMDDCLYMVKKYYPDNKK